eukprot:1046550-Pleurochrysis_carterae.AAC.2
MLPFELSRNARASAHPRLMPSDQMSAFESYSSCLITSGACTHAHTHARNNGRAHAAGALIAQTDSGGETARKAAAAEREREMRVAMNSRRTRRE